MSGREEVRQVRDQLLGMLGEDAHNVQRLLARLDALTRESGVGAHAALLRILTDLQFEDREAREHWERIAEHRRKLGQVIGRDVGLRVAVLDYFMNLNRQLTRPTLIDLTLFEASEQSATIDPSTGLAVDRVFRRSVQSELRRARRYGQKVSVALFDLDDFGEVNERFGRFTTDRILKEVGIILNNQIRDIDIAARPGEDEIALVLPQTDRNGGLLVAERVRAEVQRFFRTREVEGTMVRLTLTGGVATYPDDAASPEQLLERAAQALYHAKASGKNVILTYMPERRKFLRFDLAPGRFEVEVLSPANGPGGPAGNLSRNGILFASPEPLHVGEEVEIRLVDQEPDGGPKPFHLRGRVVRLEELPSVDPAGSSADEGRDRYEIGLVFDTELSEEEGFLLDLLERARIRREE